MSDSETAIIGALLADNSKINDCHITLEHFSVRNYGMIYDAIKNVIADNQIADVITVSERMNRATGREWLDLLVDLSTNAAGTPENVKAYQNVIQSDYSARVCRTIANRLIESSCDSVDVSAAIKDLMQIDQTHQNYEYGLDQAMKLGLTKIDQAMKNKGKLIGLDTGLSDLNSVLGGFHPGDLVIVGARPAMGKTAVLLNFLIGAGASVGCISGEQGVVQVAHRLMSIKSRVPLMKMRNGTLDRGELVGLEAGVRKIKEHPGIRFYDKSGPKMEEIEVMARRWKFDYGIKALYVDYLQKIARDMSKNKAEAIGDNASRLKNLARELDIPVICLAQVKRDVESRNNKRPFAGDISDTSESEKEADQIIMLYRDEVYNPDTYDKGVMELLIEKNRHGPTGVVATAWDGRYLTIDNLVRNDGSTIQ